MLSAKNLVISFSSRPGRTSPFKDCSFRNLHARGLIVILKARQESGCYGAAPTKGQRSLVNDQEGLGAKRRGR